ncbi:MAG: efflux RND transporter periplasmic adaptor subunit [Pseudomonadota bacterium]
MIYIALIFILIATILPVQADNPKGLHPPKVVETATARVGPIQRKAQLVGRVKSKKASTLRARRSGPIKQINFQDGAQVRHGETLLLIDDPEVVQRYEIAKQQSSLAHEEFKRQEILLKSKTGTKKKLEQAQTAWLAAQAIESQAKLELDMHTIVAPFDGVLGTFRLSQGAFIQTGDVLVNVYDPKSYYIEFEVPGDASLHLRPGQKLEVIARLAKAPLPAHIKTIESCIDTPTQTALVRADIETHAPVQPGEFVNINLVIDTSGDNVIQVPLTAMFLNEGTPHAYIIEKDKLKLVAIEPGLESAGMLEIKKGLKANDTVVVGGQLRLKDGELIKVYTK